MSALKSSERVKYDYDEVTTELAIGAGGQPYVVTRGGGKPPTIVAPTSLIRGPQTPVKKEVEVGEPFNVGGVGGPMEPAPTMMPGVGPTTDPTANLVKPLMGVKNDGEYQQALVLINMANPQAAAQLRQMMPRFDPQRMAGIRAEAMRVVTGAADQPGLVAGERGVADIPMVEGGQGGPYEGYVEAPTPFRLKDPMQAPAPGIYTVSPGQVTTTSAAEETGKKSAARIEQLKTDLPKAHSQTTSLINNLTDRINRIDKFLRSPYRNTVVGSIEGRIPEMFMNERRADAMADWKFITNNSVLDKLIQDRQSTETGASPQGLVSDRDLGVAASAANSLTRTGSEPAQEAEMKRLRDVLYRTRETALRTYNNTYGDLAKGDQRFKLSPRPVSPKYSGPLNAKKTRSGATVENWD